MTLLFERKVDGPATHAFVIGVGSYPLAKPNNTRGIASLKQVPDLPSAADSAMFMTDWLLANKDNFASKLSSLEVLISDAEETLNRYGWKHKPVDGATHDTVMAAGNNWLERLAIRPGDTAFFYCCGHGARVSARPVLFLEDLNSDKTNPWKHLDVGHLANSLKQFTHIKCAFLFSDACSEYIPKLEVASAQETRFFTAYDPYQTDDDKVSFLCAAPAASLTYDGPVPNKDGLKLGRFTQVLVKALGGASVRWWENGWPVYPSSLQDDLKIIRKVYFQGWDNLPFAHSVQLTQNECYPILYPTKPYVPVLISTDPETSLPQFDLHVSQSGSQSYLASRPRAAEVWHLDLEPSKNTFVSIADDGTNQKTATFTPDRPIINQRILV